VEYKKRLRHRSGLRALVILAVLLGEVGPVAADPPQDEKSRAEEFAQFAKREAAAYTINLEGIDRPLTLQPVPVLKWSNPVVGSIYGDVFIWTDNGRPEAVASIYRFYTPPVHRANEFHSFALGPLSAERKRFVVWTPSRPGLELKMIPDAAAPADSASARLRQMRAIAQEFTGRQTTREGVDRDMRLLAQPIYRYENTKGDLIDGGLFVFVVGTDPEVFLLIEARRPARGVAEWRFAATRMNNVNLRLNHRGREVWNVPELPWPQVYDSGQVYAVFGYDVDTESKR
jgi:hypothetical protein